MRKVLFATTALVALGSASAMAADVSISGGVDWEYNSFSSNPTQDGKNNGTFIDQDTDLRFTMTETSDSGLTYKLVADINEGGDMDDETLSIAGDFGTIMLTNGVEGAGDMADHVESVKDASTLLGAKSGTTFVGIDGSDNATFQGAYATAGTGAGVTYKLPGMNGFSAAVTFADAGRASRADRTEYHVAYDTAVAGGSMKLSYTAANVDADGAAGSNNGSDATSLSVSLSMNGITVGGQSNTKSEDDNSADFEGTVFGVSYAVSDSISVAALSKEASDDKDSSYDFSQNAASISYTIAPGLAAHLTVTDSEFTDYDDEKMDDSFTVFSITASF
jgi:hypothetical protein